MKRCAGGAGRFCRRFTRLGAAVHMHALAASVAAITMLVGCHTTAGGTGATPTAGGSGATTARGAGTSGGANRSPAGDTGGKVLDFPAFWSRRTDLVDKASTVDATVLFALRCPPPGASPGACVAIAYIADDHLGSLPAQPEDVALALYDRGRPIACSAQTVAGLTCSGWRDGIRYRLRGVVRHQSVQGRNLPNLVFDVTEHTTRR